MNANRRHKILAITLAALAFIGCHRHEYHDLPPQGGSLRVEFDWNGYTDIPPGMNLVFYPSGGSQTTPVLQQIQYDGDRVSLPAGAYDAVVYNDYTYNIYYRGMESYLTAEAYLQDYDRQPLASRAPSVRNVEEPDIFYVAQINGLTVRPSDGDRTLTLRPELKTLELSIHVEVEGIHNVSMADGSITGSAGSLMLSTGLPRPDAPDCKRLFPFAVDNEGLHAETRMFLGTHPLENTYILELAFLLRDNTVSMGKFSYDVSDQIIPRLKEHDGKIPPEGIDIRIRGVEVDEVPGGGFNAVVDPWGDIINIELQ